VLIVDTLNWLLASEEPWTRYRALLDLAGSAPDEPDVLDARKAMLEHELVGRLLEKASEWPGDALRRHNDAAHPLYAITTLADLGLDRRDGDIVAIADAVLSHFDGDQFETLVWLPRFLTKEDDAQRLAWMMCDAPSLLYALLSFGYESHPDVQRALSVLIDRAEDNGWRCGAASSLPAFSGPGRKLDTCPIATTYTLKALATVPEVASSPAAAAGVTALLDHWEHQADYKLKMFGIGTDFRMLKYPFVWYDILHVADVLSRYPQACADPRLVEMVREITRQADDQGRYRAGSMYRAWKEWSFADKRRPSPYLTLLATRIAQRVDAPDAVAR
jgi:hypothetical protein